MRKLLFVIGLGASSALVHAEFVYQETSQMTGGSMLAMLKMAGPFASKAREPNVSTHMLKGDRMVTLTRDRASVIDVGKETITEIDFGKKTYSVMTFAEMKQAMETPCSAFRNNRLGTIRSKPISKYPQRPLANPKSCRGWRRKNWS